MGGSEKWLYDAAESALKFTENISTVAFGNTKSAKFVMKSFSENEKNMDKLVVVTSDKMEYYADKYGLKNVRRYSATEGDSFIPFSDVLGKEYRESLLGTPEVIAKREEIAKDEADRLKEIGEAEIGKRLLEDFPPLGDKMLDNIVLIEYSDLTSEASRYAFIAGADQINPGRHMIKGGKRNIPDPAFSGSVKAEKELASFAHPFLVVVDYKRNVEYLGQDGYGLPVEFIPGSERLVKEYIEHILEVPRLSKHKNFKKMIGRRGGFLVTENGMHVFDVPFDGRRYQNQLPVKEQYLEKFDKIYSTGLFASRQPDVIKVATKDGPLTYAIGYVSI